MNTYVITEKQDVASTREGETVKAKNLTAAKRKATRLQMFKGTVLTIHAENGVLLATKQNGNWDDE